MGSLNSGSNLNNNNNYFNNYSNNFNPNHFNSWSSNINPNFNLNSSTSNSNDPLNKSKRKRTDDIDMSDLKEIIEKEKRPRTIRRPLYHTQLNEPNNTLGSSNTTIYEVNDFGEKIDQDEDLNVNMTLNELKNRQGNGAVYDPSSTSNSSELILYQQPKIKIPQGLDASQIWNRLELDHDGVIHLFNKITGEEQLLNISDLHGGELQKRVNGNSSVLLEDVSHDSDSDVESTPRIVEITDEEEQEILKKQHQKKVKQLESELSEMDLD